MLVYLRSMKQFHWSDRNSITVFKRQSVDEPYKHHILV